MARAVAILSAAFGVADVAHGSVACWNAASRVTIASGSPFAGSAGGTCATLANNICAHQLASHRASHEAELQGRARADLLRDKAALRAQVAREKELVARERAVILAGLAAHPAAITDHSGQVREFLDAHRVHLDAYRVHLAHEAFDLTEELAHTREQAAVAPLAPTAGRFLVVFDSGHRQTLGYEDLAPCEEPEDQGRALSGPTATPAAPGGESAPLVPSVRTVRTHLADPSAAGATIINVDSHEGFAEGDSVTISGGGNSEVATIERSWFIDFENVGSLALKEALKHGYPVGSSVVHAIPAATTAPTAAPTAAPQPTTAPTVAAGEKLGEPKTHSGSSFMIPLAVVGGSVLFLAVAAVVVLRRRVRQGKAALEDETVPDIEDNEVEHNDVETGDVDGKADEAPTLAERASHNEIVVDVESAVVGLDGAVDGAVASAVDSGAVEGTVDGGADGAAASERSTNSGENGYASARSGWKAIDTARMEALHRGAWNDNQRLRDQVSATGRADGTVDGGADGAAAGERSTNSGENGYASARPGWKAIDTARMEALHRGACNDNQRLRDQVSATARADGTVDGGADGAATGERSTNSGENGYASARPGWKAVDTARMEALHRGAWNENGRLSAFVSATGKVEPTISV